jgi:gluconate 5-dehydrogenase
MARTPTTWSFDPASMFNLAGQTAVVTGAASGLGRAIAHGFAVRNATVVCADINIEDATTVAENIGNNATAVKVDVTDTDSLQALRDGVIEEFGGYDILCNIPGINTRQSVLELSEARWRQILEVNLTGVFLAAKVLGEPLVNQQSGSVINMASIRGLDGGPNQSAYSASKGGVVQLTKGLAAEWAPGVRVNALAPGYMKTPLVREAMDDKEWQKKMREGHMLERFGEPEEVVGAAIYLAAEASSFVTGTILSVDGGWTAQ